MSRLNTMFTQNANIACNNATFSFVNLDAMKTTFDILLEAARTKFPNLVDGPSDLARLLDESPQTITNWKKRGAPKGKIVDIAAKIGVPVEILAHEPSSQDDIKSLLGPAIQTPLRPVRAIDNPDEIEHDILQVPRYTLRASCGTGEPVFDVDELGEPNYTRRSWATRHGYKPENLFTIAAVGDSMAPDILDGDSLTVHKQTNIVAGKPMVICYRGECFAKHLIRQVDGSVTIKSRNPDYRDVTIPPELAEELHVVGLVVSVARNV